MSAFNSDYTPGPGGAYLASVYKGVEDAIFWDGATKSQWIQEWDKYTPHYGAMILQTFTNQGMGNPMTCNMMRTVDYLWTSYIGMFCPAIAPNTDAGAEDVYYVNAPVAYSTRNFIIRCGSQLIFQVNGNIMMMMMEFAGVLDQLAELVGFCKTSDQLSANAKKDQYYFQPLYGLPIHNPSTAFTVSALGWHGVTAELQSRTLGEMYVNVGSAIKKGSNPLPTRVSSERTLGDTDIQYIFATNCIWASKQERNFLLDNYQERIYKEIKLCGSKLISASTIEHKENIEIDATGPCTWLAVEIVATKDSKAGKWLKTCKDDGEDYISHMMFYFGTTAREDGLPAKFYRLAKVHEVFHVAASRYIYVMGFETDDRDLQPNGHQNLTSFDKKYWQGKFPPHEEDLQVNIYECAYNAWYSIGATGGRMWE